MNLPSKHALIALGDLHEHYELLTDPEAPRPAFAMQQYMKSLHRVASLDISRSDTTIGRCFSILRSVLPHLRAYKVTISRP